MNEPKIIINGIDIGIGCALSLRMALSVFVMELIEQNNNPKAKELGVDVELNNSYLDRISDLWRILGYE